MSTKLEELKEKADEEAKKLEDQDFQVEGGSSASKGPRAAAKSIQKGVKNTTFCDSAPPVALIDLKLPFLDYQFFRFLDGKKSIFLKS